ncbi:DUF4180 domain-containing protein [Pseudoxanthomonas sp. SGD-10]|nr:DUF4180 domain-containing protein [Pseudoxanthomonas sp. SGD-10]
MTIKDHLKGNHKVAEIIADYIFLNSVNDGLDILGNVYYMGYDKVIIHEKNISPAFFDLKTRVAGEILQKFAQYAMPIAIIGQFSKFESKSLNDFIYESNKGKQVNFFATVEAALSKS